MGRLSDLGTLPLHSNDRPLEKWWTLRDAARQWSRDRLVNDATAGETAREVAEWLAAKAAHEVDFAQFDAAVSGRDVFTASMVWGFAGEEYAALMGEVRRRQSRLGYRPLNGW
jgi:hypothetical protein